MKKSSFLINCGILIATLPSLQSCSLFKLGTTPAEPIYLETATPEEVGLNLTKLTDESQEVVIAATSSTNTSWTYNWALGDEGVIEGLWWYSTSNLDISPDGKKLAYLTRANGVDNIMVRDISGNSMTTQRTFRNISSFTWGVDNKLYFGDWNSPNYYICCVSAIQGNLMEQLTNGTVVDKNPVLSYDSTRVFFTRTSTTLGPSIWAYNLKTNTLTSCARGYNQCLIKDNPNAFYCVRNTTNRKSEIWFVDYVNGKETIVLSDPNRSFTNPRLSPDGKWILCVGSSTSSINHKKNTDIYVVRTDGTNLTQLTYHPEKDINPVWSADGKTIYFISSRANEKQKHNIWSMNFTLQ